MISKGKMPGVTRIGRRVLITRDRLFRYLRTNSTGPDEALS